MLETKKQPYFLEVTSIKGELVAWIDRQGNFVCKDKKEMIKTFIEIEKSEHYPINALKDICQNTTIST